MTRVRSCDDHPKYRAGCGACNARSRVYENRRWYLQQQGQRLSTGSQLVTDWLQQLRAAGYRLADIAAYSGLHFKQVYRLSVGGSEWVHLKTYWAVERTYRELSPFPGPSRQASAWAQRHGWKPPPLLPMPEVIVEEIVDEVAVRRAASGDRTVCLTRAERLAAWETLEAQGMSARQIEAALGVSARSVVRWRSGKHQPHGRHAP